jgi:hypothetical protein
MFVLNLFSERGRLFFSPGFAVPTTWWQPELEQIWEQLQPLRSSIFQATAGTNLQELGVTLAVPQNVYTLLKVRL